MAEFEGTVRELLAKVDPQAAAVVRPQTPLPLSVRTPTASGSTSRSMATRALGPSTSRRKAQPITQPIDARPRALRWVAVAGVVVGAALAGWLGFRSDDAPRSPTPQAVA